MTQHDDNNKERADREEGAEGSATVKIQVASAERTLVEKTRKLADNARAGKLSQLETEIADGVWPQHEKRIPRDGYFVDYPSHLARIPLFKADKIREKERTSDNPEILITPFGSTKRWGPGLNSYDDETFLALAHLFRTDQHKGPRKALARKLGIAVVPPDRDGTDENTRKIIESWSLEHAKLESGRGTAKDICEFLGDGRGGFPRQARRESVARLKNQNLTHLVVKGVKLARPSIFVPPWMADEEGKLKSDVEWDDKLFYYAGDPDVEGEFQITWSESMTALLTSFTLLEAQVYVQLTAYAKFIYKYIASVMSTTRAFTIRFHKLALYIDYGSKLRTLDGIAIPQETLQRITMLPDDHATAALTDLRIDWREMKRIVTGGIAEVNERQKRFELYIPPTKRGEIPVLRALS